MPFLLLFLLTLILNAQAMSGSDILMLVADILLILATVWTIFSGIEYLIGARWLFQQDKH